MPFKSLAQMKLMYAMAKKGTKVPKKVAKEFIKDSEGQDISSLPKFVKLKKLIKGDK